MSLQVTVYREGVGKKTEPVAPPELPSGKAEMVRLFAALGFHPLQARTYVAEVKGSGGYFGKMALAAEAYCRALQGE